LSITTWLKAVGILTVKEKVEGLVPITLQSLPLGNSQYPFPLFLVWGHLALKLHSTQGLEDVTMLLLLLL